MNTKRGIPWIVKASFSLCLLLAPAAAQDTKPTIDELLARHLVAIGPTSLRTSITNRVVEGQVVVESTRAGKAAAAPSTAHFITQSDKYRVSMPFPEAGYMGWDVAYDGQGSVRSLTAWQSAIAPFLSDCSGVVKAGLLGGVLSTAWPLLDPRARKALGPVSASKIDGHPIWRLTYTGAGVIAHLDFDAATYRHVRTDYHDCSDLFLGVEERFQDFSGATGLMLPASWKVEQTNFRRAQQVQRLVTWTFTVQRIQQNGEIPPQVFTLGGPVPQLKPTSKSSAPSGVP